MDKPIFLQTYLRYDIHFDPRKEYFDVRLQGKPVSSFNTLKKAKNFIETQGLPLPVPEILNIPILTPYGHKFYSCTIENIRQTGTYVSYQVYKLEETPTFTPSSFWLMDKLPKETQEVVLNLARKISSLRDQINALEVESNQFSRELRSILGPPDVNVYNTTKAKEQYKEVISYNRSTLLNN